MTRPPTIDQLRNLADRAASGLSADEQQRLREGIDHLANQPPTDRMHDVQGRCPACGWTSLFLGNGGYITCSRIECPQPDAATEVIADFWKARQHAAFTFCPQNVGHVTMTEFAKKITEKRTALAQREAAVRYANEQKQRADHAEAANARVRTAVDDLCHEPHPSHDHVCPDDVRRTLLAALPEPAPATPAAPQTTGQPK
jgi:hypothetical protein